MQSGKRAKNSNDFFFISFEWQHRDALLLCEYTAADIVTTDCNLLKKADEKGSRTLYPRALKVVVALLF